MSTTNIPSDFDNFTNYKYKILNRIQRELAQQKISQKRLGEACGLSQPSISKLLRGDSPLTLDFLYKVCNVFDMTIDTLLSAKDTLTDKMSIMNPHAEDVIYTNMNSINDAIVSDPALYPFRGILGTYQFYCNPTISSENKLLTGTLSFKPFVMHEKTFCQCELILYTGKYDINGEKEKKIYTGNMLISLPMQSCYCILSCNESAEFVFLLFHHIFLTKADLECRILAVLTTSAGSHRRPTMEKAIISRTKLSQEDLKEIEGQLKMNCSNIRIRKSDFDEYILKELPEKIASPNCEEIYCIDESLIKSSSLSPEKQLELINKLRKYSTEKRYTKVSTHADDILYNFITNKKRKTSKFHSKN